MTEFDPAHNVANAVVRMFALMGQDEDGNEGPVVSLAVREDPTEASDDSPLQCLDAAVDSWKHTIVPAIDTHLRYLTDHLQRSGDTCTSFVPVAGFMLQNPFMKLQISTATCAHEARVFIEGINQVREQGDQRVKVWAGTAYSLREIDTTLTAAQKEQ